MAFSYKKHPFEVLFVFLRGLERIRTAVEAFAELCLATRPQDHIFFIGLQKYKTRAKVPKFFRKKI